MHLVLHDFNLRKTDTGEHFVATAGARTALFRHRDLSHPDVGPDYSGGAFESCGPFSMG